MTTTDPTYTFLNRTIKQVPHVPQEDPADFRRLAFVLEYNETDLTEAIDLTAEMAAVDGLIQTIAKMRHDPVFKDRIAFIEDYDINVCRHMVQGVDVWLNNPRRPLEAPALPPPGPAAHPPGRPPGRGT